ncbi:MAG: MMPL family transporter, partial [Methanomassiliicoccaceae archaeon]|nr:MMPL family transporter [Methanomassiliicoccaceae archaeon]
LVMAVTMTEMNNSQMTSLIMTIIVVLIILTIVMYFYHRSLVLGAMATIPTLISVIMVWGTMALMDIPMNVLTLTIASLTVGMGVTYGIHISHRYMGELRGSEISARDAIKKTTRETGKGVFAAALTTITGFGVFGFSKMLPFFQFGLITALAIGFSYLGAIFILPSMLTLWGERIKPKLDKKRESQNED